MNKAHAQRKLKKYREKFRLPGNKNFNPEVEAKESFVETEVPI